MKTYFRILTFAKPFKKYILLSVFCTMVYSLSNGASIYLAIPLLDTLFQESTSVVTEQPTTSSSFFLDDIKNSLNNFLRNFILSGTKSESLIKICLLILTAFLLKNIFSYLQAYFLAYVEQGVVKSLREKVYNHLHLLPMSFFKNEKTGNLISIIMNDINVVQSSVSTVFLNLIREPFTILVFLGIALSISWKLTLASVLVLPPSIAIIAWIGIKLRKQSGILQERMAELTNLIYETITGVKIVKAYGMEQFEKKKFAEETYRFFKTSLRIVRIRNSASPLTEFLSVLVGVVMIYVGGKFVLEGQSLKASEFLGFLFALFQLMPPIKELSAVNNKIQESTAAGNRVFEVLDTQPAIVDHPEAVPLNSFNKEIEFINVAFHYDDGEEEALSDINFSVNKGEIIALVGPSGGGKSTLVDLIPRFYDTTAGEILIDGIPIKKIKIKDLRARMGIVTQETILFNDTIKNNIAYGLENFPMEKIIDAAKAANAHNFILELPKQYDTIIGEKGIKLSGGQRQRISIARAILKNPEIMIFDEATSALDNESEVLVQEALEKLMQNRTTFVIAHRLSTIRKADKIIVIDKGKIVQVGNHESLFEDINGIYRKFYEMQFRD